jgi:amino acid transporter
MATPGQRVPPTLARNAVGLPAVVFRSVATMAPGVGLAYSIGVGAFFAGGALPLSVVLSLVACLLVAVAIGQMAKHLPPAGGPATYAARGLHPSFGFVVAWVYSGLYFVAIPFLVLLIGYLFAGVVEAEFNWNYTAFVGDRRTGR